MSFKSEEACLLCNCK